MYFDSFNICDKVKFSQEPNPQTIIEDGDRKIMVFGLNKNQKLPTHSSPVDVALYVIKGELSLVAENQTYKIKKEEMFLIPENKEHSVEAQKDSIFLVVRI